jgi:hypothetical protein
MKKLIFICLFAIIALSSRQTLKAQITLEHTYDNTALSTLFMVDFDASGVKYGIIGQYGNSTITFYNLDHSLFKTLNIPPIPNPNYSNLGYLYFSDHLFNLDDSIEYIIDYFDNTNYSYHTYIYTESGNVLFEVDGGLNYSHTAPIWLQVYPIYNTPNGTKMPIYMNTGECNIYSLPGTLHIPCCNDSFGAGMQNPIGNSNNNGMSIYPNPSNGNTTIEFNLPQGVNQGEIVIYNMQGVELKSYKVDNTFHTLLLNNSEFHAGTYFYQLRTANGVSGAKKMIVIN